MLGGLYDRIASRPGGGRGLASARLRRRVVVLLHQALADSGLTQSALAAKLGIRRSAVNQVFRGDGNVRIDTLAEYLHEMGCELDARLVEAGEHRRAFEEDRQVEPLRHVHPSSSTSTVKPLILTFPPQKVRVCPAAFVDNTLTVPVNAFQLTGWPKAGVFL